MSAAAAGFAVPRFPAPVRAALSGWRGLERLGLAKSRLDETSLLAAARSHPNYTLRTRRPELFGELVRDQVRS